jgi:hypothetical protein
MASPNSTFTELVSTTFRKHRKEIKDNVSNNNALYRRLVDGDRYRTEDGGLTIVCPIDYQANGTYQRYSGFDVLNVQQSDVISAAEYVWQQIALNVVADGRTLRINSGTSKIINLVKARIKNAMRTFANNFSFDMYSDGTLPNQINGLQALVSDAGTGTVGGINSSTWTFWQNTVQSAAAPLQGGGAVTVSATTIEGDIMLPLWMELVRGDDKPDLILASNDWFRFFEASQVSLKRYTASGDSGGRFKGTAGFDALKYKSADVIFDGGSGIPTSHMYFLNSDYLELVVHRDADLSVEEELKPTNQDGAIIPILWMGNMVCSNRDLQGVAKA